MSGNIMIWNNGIFGGKSLKGKCKRKGGMGKQSTREETEEQLGIFDGTYKRY